MSINNLISVNLDLVRLEPTVARVSQYAKNAKFFNSAVEHYNFYAIPPAYKKDGYYNALGFYSSIDAKLKNKNEEIIINLIELTEDKILDFLLAFQYQEHKEERCMAELIKVCQEYTSKPSGKKWLKKNTSNEDKEEQYAELFGISTYTAKCYFKVLQPNNKIYLDKLAKNYSLHKAYMECLRAEKDAKPTSEKPASRHDASNKKEEPSNLPEQPVAIGNSNIRRARAEEPEPILSDDEVQSHLEDYRNRLQPNDESSAPEQEFALKVSVDLFDGTKLELPGKIDMVVDGAPIRSIEQLIKGTDGIWRLPEHSSPITLTVYPEDDDFFRDF